MKEAEMWMKYSTLSETKTLSFKKEIAKNIEFLSEKVRSENEWFFGPLKVTVQYSSHLRYRYHAIYIVAVLHFEFFLLALICCDRHSGKTSFRCFSQVWSGDLFLILQIPDLEGGIKKQIRISRFLTLLEG
jgi:hypothetical protein